jgi:perosamine synthetase
MSVGARPVYVDVQAAGINMDANDLAKKVGRKTKAVVVQHSFGLPADLIQLRSVARENNLGLVEDCAHTIASTLFGQTVGTFGDAAFYSYEAAKPVFIGIGGSAISNNATITEKLERDYSSYESPPALSQAETAGMFIAHRIAYRPATYWAVRSIFRALSAAGLIRGNYNKIADDRGPASDFSRRMGDVQRRRLAQQLRTLAAQTSHRRRVASAYRARISSAGVAHIPVPKGAEPVFGRYPVFAVNKEALIERARDAKVELAVFYDSAVQPLYGASLRTVGYEPGSCPNAEWAAARIVSLPTGMNVGQREIDRAVDFLNAVGRATA